MFVLENRSTRTTSQSLGEQLRFSSARTRCWYTIPKDLLEPRTLLIEGRGGTNNRAASLHQATCLERQRFPCLPLTDTSKLARSASTKHSKRGEARGFLPCAHYSVPGLHVTRCAAPARDSTQSQCSLLTSPQEHPPLPPVVLPLAYGP